MPTNPTPIRILGIPGSLRRRSFNRLSLQAVQELLPEGVTMEIADLSAIPVFNEDVEAQGYPEPVQQFKAQIAAADGLLFATPEYNYSIPGVLKNAIDWASRPGRTSPFVGKPVGVIGASPGVVGTARAQYHLRQVFVGTNMLPLNRPEVFIAKAKEKFDAEGTLTDQPTRDMLASFVTAYLEWTRRLTGK